MKTIAVALAVALITTNPVHAQVFGTFSEGYLKRKAEREEARKNKPCRCQPGNAKATCCPIPPGRPFDLGK